MTYNDGAAFRRALEDRLLAQSRQSGLALVRLRKLVAFDRVLARLTIGQPGQWLLKGGVALQLRLGNLARTTKDIDILLGLPHGAAHQALVRAVRIDLADWFEFNVESARGPLPGAGEGGLRFPVTAMLDGRVFRELPHRRRERRPGDRVTRDLSHATSTRICRHPTRDSPLLSGVAAHRREGTCLRPPPRHWREHPGARPRRSCVARAELFAERGEAAGSIGSDVLARDGVASPTRLPDPPPEWRIPFKLLCSAVGLGDLDLTQATTEVRCFLEPALGGSVVGTWSPEKQMWG